MRKELVEAYKQNPDCFEEYDLNSRCAGIEKVLIDRIKAILHRVPNLSVQGVEDFNLLTSNFGYRSLVIISPPDFDIVVTIIPFRSDEPIKMPDIKALMELRGNEYFKGTGCKHYVVNFANDKDYGGQAIPGTTKRFAESIGAELIRWDVFIDRLIKKAPR